MKSSNGQTYVGQRRWTVLVGGFLLSLMGGMSYAWGSFTVPLIQDWGWKATEVQLPFTVMIIVFAIAMIPAGWVQDKIGPRRVAMIGAVLFLVGYGLSGLLRFIPNHWWLILCYGGVVGAACGLTYACIAPTARKWYPDHSGFAVSCGVMGFGLAAVVFAPLKKLMIATWDVDGTLIALGIFTFLGAFIGARLMRIPSEDLRTRLINRTPDQPKPESAPFVDITPGQFVRTPVFFMLWVALAMVIGGGLTAIGLITAYGEMKLLLAPTTATIAISFYSLMNGLGRPFAGWFADKIGAIKVMIAVYCVQAVVFLLLPAVATSLPILVICTILLGMGYAVTFGLFPVVVAQIVGNKYLGTNYGLVFSAFGLGAITSLMGSWLLDSTGSFTPAFLLAGSTTIVGIILLLVMYMKYKVR